MTRVDLRFKVTLFFIWAGFFFLFYSLNSGLTCTNDGSHYAFIRALYQTGSGKLLEEARWAKHDSARFNDEYYSDRHPGTAFIGVAFSRLASPFSAHFRDIVHAPSITESIGATDLRNISILMLLPALAGSLLLLVLIDILLALGHTKIFSVLLAISFMLGTLFLRYSTVLYSHIFAALFVSLSFMLLLKYVKTRGLLTLFVACLSFGFAIIVEHLSIVLAPAFFCYLLLKDWRLIFGWRRFFIAIIGLIIPLGPFFVYNYLSFGNPFCIAHFHHSIWGSFHTPRAVFPGRKIAVRTQQIFFSGTPFVSLFGSAAHLLLLGFLPICFIRTRFRSVESLILTVCVICGLTPIVFASSSSGWDLDYRHVVFAVPFVVLLWSLVLGDVLTWCKARWYQMLILLGVVASVIYSANLQFNHIRHPRQPFMPGNWYNVEAAVYNVLPIVGVVGTLMLLSLLCNRVIRQPKWP